jgi:hypothetical protein
MKRRISIYVDERDYELLLYRANNECRSLNSFISYILKCSNDEFSVSNDFKLGEKN